MATVTGEVAVDFAGVGDTNPYTNANFDELTGPARIASGLWRTPDPGTLAQWHLDPGTYTFGNVIRAKIEIAPAGGADAYDGLWVNIMDASGNGYGFRMGVANVLARVRWDAFSSAAVATDSSQTAADGAQLELEYTKSTGAVRCYYNGVLISALNLTDTTHAGLTLQAGLAQRPQNLGDGGIRSFAADGLAGGGTVNTQTLTDTLAASDQAFRSVIRGAVLTDSLVLQDFLSWWWYRTRTLSDSVVVTEGQTETYTQYNAQMTDELTVTDELIWWLRRNRMLQDDIAITDELISSIIGYLIFVSVLTSNVTVTDQSQGFTFFNRLLDSNLLTTDQALRALWVTRELIDEVSIDDSIGSSVQRFILLTDAISLEDSLTATYIPETGPAVDNPIIRIGFDQPAIDLGGYGLN